MKTESSCLSKNFRINFDLEINFLQYFQMIAAIPSEIKCSAYKTQITPDDLFKMEDILQLTKNFSLSLVKMSCKHYYKLFNENCIIVPTGVKAWEQLFPESFVSWKANFQKIYKIIKDNKLRQFLFKLLHRITVTKRELKRFKITVDDQCFLCSSKDSIFHTFLDCPTTSSIYTDIVKWFNNVSNLKLTPPNEQILFHIKEQKCKLTNAQERRLDILLLYTKYYLYTCKTLSKTPNFVELQRKIEWLWKLL